MKNIITFAIFIITAGSLTGCGGGSSSSNEVTGLSSIVGVYDWSDEYPGGIIDEWYLGIDAQGYVSDYDYMGDSFDNLANCYVIDRNWERLTHISGNRFATLSGVDVLIDFHQGQLRITGQGSAFGSEIIGPRVNIHVSTFEAAECVFGAPPPPDAPPSPDSPLDEP